MTTLTSKVPGMDVWAYDFARRPDKSLVHGQPQMGSYCEVNSRGDKLNPATHEPTEYTNSTVNSLRYAFDVNHCSSGAILVTHGIKWATSDPIDNEIQTQDYASVERFTPVMFYGEDVYIKPKLNPNTGKPMESSRRDSKTPFTTKTPGIKILYQTGIVQYRRGYGVILFELEKGYKIPTGAIIKATPKVQNDFSGMLQDGEPETYKIVHDIVPGIYEITVTTDRDTDWDECTIDFQTKQDVSTLPHSKVTFELSHCTVKPSETSVVNGVHSWTFTADTGYVFNYPGGIVNPNTGMRGDEIPATKTNITTLNNYNIQDDTEIQLSAQKQQAETIPFVQNLTHIRSNVTSTSISRKLNAIQLTADSGYNFQSDIQVLFYVGSSVSSEYNVTGNNKSDITIPLNTTKDNTITDNMTNIVLTASATKIEQHVGYEHNYLITDTELNALSNEQIWNYVGGDTNEEHYNVSAYINNLVELPFKVDTKTSVERISLGRVQAHTVSHEAKSKIINLDLGVVTVPKKYNNAYDYQTQSIKLYTPFVAPITIDPVNAINKAIHIVYNVDLSNGNLTINLYNDDVLFFTGTNNIGSQLPFLNTLKNTIINRDTHFNDNNVRQAYIVVTREAPILDNDYYPTIERGLIKNYNENVKVRLLNNMNIPNNELAELTNKLESGVKYVESN